MSGAEVFTIHVPSGGPMRYLLGTSKKGDP